MMDSIARIRGTMYKVRCKLSGKSIEIGDGLKLYKRLSIIGPGKVVIGRDCVVTGVPGDASQYVTIDTHNPDAMIFIGDNATLCAARITSRFMITIGNDVLIEESGIADTDFHTIGKTREFPKSESIEKSKVTIGDRVCIGARSVVTKGVTIGSDVIITPGSIVSASLKDNCMAMGNPARPMME